MTSPITPLVGTIGAMWLHRALICNATDESTCTLSSLSEIYYGKPRSPISTQAFIHHQSPFRNWSITNFYLGDCTLLIVILMSPISIQAISHHWSPTKDLLDNLLWDQSSVIHYNLGFVLRQPRLWERLGLHLNHWRTCVFEARVERSSRLLSFTHWDGFRAMTKTLASDNAWYQPW